MAIIETHTESNCMGGKQDHKTFATDHSSESRDRQASRHLVTARIEMHASRPKMQLKADQPPTPRDNTPATDIHICRRSACSGYSTRTDATSFAPLSQPRWSDAFTSLPKLKPFAALMTKALAAPLPLATPLRARACRLRA